MKRRILMTSLFALIQGCATRLDVPAASRSLGADPAASASVLHFQDSSVTPGSDEQPMVPQQLQPGDIVLTSTSTLRSAGIQLTTFAPVSHVALYIGDQQVVEAVGSGVRVRGVDKLLEEEAVALVLRRPDLTAQQARDVRASALRKVGAKFNYLGVAMQVPFSINRRLCELPLAPQIVRDACIRSIGSVYQLASSRDALFCSQLVMQAYRQAGVPITDADPRLMSPADILHMREGDVPSVKVHRPLQYVGHLKYEVPTAVALGQ